MPAVDEAAGICFILMLVYFGRIWVQAHKEAIARYEEAAKELRDNEPKESAEEVLPVLQKTWIIPGSQRNVKIYTMETNGKGNEGVRISPSFPFLTFPGNDTIYLPVHAPEEAEIEF